ncbi:MAG: pyridoxamine 5'-phosphate oxidase family protein [Acidobacteria bacterium]|nr:pyridoxamine 5'-phosphate oxidase family protein [Acidobacteriota bacterium]
MNTAYEFLKANQVFHLATVDGEKARVRPFGFTMVRDNRIYFCTNNTKDVYRQMVKQPDIEISAMGADGTWLRVRGKVAFDQTRDAKAQAFTEAPNLLAIYPKGAEDETFITFYFTEAQATLSSFTTAPKDIPLV